MKRKITLITLSFMIFAQFFVMKPVIYSQTQPGYTGGVELGTLCGGGAYPPHNPVRVLLAYDEEIANSFFHWFGIHLSGEAYVFRQTLRALSRFPFDLEIATTMTWDSNDTAILPESLLELEEELGWYSGMFYKDYYIDILVGWTGQDNDCLGGVAHKGYGSCLNKIQVDWTDDNTVQHEVTHLFGVHDHCLSTDCVMSVLEQWYCWIWEDLSPYSGGAWISIWNWQQVGSMSPNWCNYHYQTLKGSRGSISRSPEMFEDSEINPCNPPEEPPPEKREINPTHPEIPVIIGLGVFIGACAAILISNHRRKQRPELNT